ncbi:prepilin-type N-terminal cleavage/methylation domain-containing protein [Opitutaceae bacterium TAV1]|nr:prepilin-type N-terminal cleavage/methylation domain-containing protein [Opitutaceae bacterium TAV1]
MTKYTQHPRKGFTLIELLTVIAIIGILAAIIIPTVGKVRETAKKMVAASNLRQVGQASLIYATDNNDNLPSTNAAVAGTNIGGYTGVLLALADGGGLNDASIWFANGQEGTIALSTVNSGTNKTTLQTTALTNNSYAYVAGLSATDASTTPIAWSKGLANSGSWSDNASNSPWKKDGGHIVFLGGNVAWYKGPLSTNSGVISTNGTPTANIFDAVPSKTGTAVYNP